MTLLVGSIFHMTRKIVSEMTYNVSMGTLNPTIPYYTSGGDMKSLKLRKDVLVRGKWRWLIRGTVEDSDDSGG